MILFDSIHLSFQQANKKCFSNKFMLYFNDLDDEAEIIRPGKMLNDSQLNMYHAKEKVIVSHV